MDSAFHKMKRLVYLAGGCVVLAACTCVRADALSDEAEQLKTTYAADLEQLADWCGKQGLVEQARQTRLALGPHDPYKLYLPVLPREVGPTKLPRDASEEVVEWNARFNKLRREHAGKSFDLARRAVRHRPSLAYVLALRAIHANPDNESVRRLFGYQKYHNQWHTFYEVRQLRAGKVRHEEFGWIPTLHVRRYEQGQRYYQGRWVSAEEDARLHAEIRSGWIIETEHYAIRTNHSIEAAVQLSAKLERLYHIWSQIFVRYYASEADVVALFDGRTRIRRAQPVRFRVAYFRDRDDYNRSLRAAMPNIGISVGVYIEQTRTAYFFAGEGYADRTLYHEATHQLFHQSRRVAPYVGRKANFWIVEGIAMYMESLREENGHYVLGGFDDARMHAARVRLLRDDFHVPLAELTTYGMEKLQTDERIGTLYSEAAGLTSFLVYYDGGRYRDALVAYLSTVYDGRDMPDTLALLTGTAYSELDRQYRKFMEESVAASR